MRYADLDQIPLKLAREGRISGDTVSFTLPARTPAATARHFRRRLLERRLCQSHIIFHFFRDEDRSSDLYFYIDIYKSLFSRLSYVTKIA